MGAAASRIHSLGRVLTALTFPQLACVFYGVFVQVVKWLHTVAAEELAKYRTLHCCTAPQGFALGNAVAEC